MESKTAYIYTLSDIKQLEQEARVYEQLQIPYVWQNHTPLPVQAHAALGMKEQAQFNPVKLLSHLAEQLEIYEYTEVLDISSKKVVTENGTIEAEQIVLATHFPMVNIPGGYFAKMYQQRSYAVAIKDAPQIDGMYIDGQDNGPSFRNYKNYLILGGGGHKTGTKGGGFEELQTFASIEYPDREISFAWATQECMSLDGIPSINLVSAVGNILRPGKCCTHMGCALRWNPGERAWDCPCHGSKFTENGKVLENPAKRKLNT